MTALKDEYIRVIKNGRCFYGGNQNLFSDKTTQFCGCGIVAALDTLMYLQLHHAAPCQFLKSVLSPNIDFYEYESLVQLLRKRCFPLIPRLGINGLMLTAGLNSILKRNSMPFKARLGAPKREIFSAIDTMLQNNIPVILSIGPSFPAMWIKDPLTLYRKNAAGEYLPMYNASSHYITVTESDDKWLCVASWGERLYISKDEYVRHTKAHSIELFNTIIYISKEEKR